MFATVSLFSVLLLVAGASSQAAMNMSGMNMNYNLSTPQGILGFLNMEGINPSSVVIQNCIANGNSCSGSSLPCCLSPVFSCQGSPGRCLVIAAHAPHVPQIRQIFATLGVTTQNPIQ